MNTRLRATFLCFIILFLLAFTLPRDGFPPRYLEIQSGYSLSQASTDIDYLIITSNDFEPHVQPLATWKMHRGLVSGIETVEDISETYQGVDLAEKIRNCIMDYHNNYNTLWVVLAGGDIVIPTRTVTINGNDVSSDYYYSNLDDNWELGVDGCASVVDADDWEAEVYVGRLPADTESQLIRLVTSLIQYERNPPIGPWMKNAVFAGTFCNFNYDINGNNVFDEGDFGEFDSNRNHNWMKSNILPDDWTSTVLAECEGLKMTDYPYNSQLNESSLIAAINEGATMVMTDAHGSSFGMYRTIFSYDEDGDSLFDPGADSSTSTCFLDGATDFDPEGKLGMYFLAACSTGTFVGGTCLTELIVRNNGIGCIGSSQSAGYDPFWYDGEHLGWMTQGLSERFWSQLLSEGNNHPGKALALAKDDYGVDRVAMAGDDDGGKTLAQYNLMGDPEVPIWTDIPSSFIGPSTEFVESSRELIVDITDISTETSGIVITLLSTDFYHRVVTADTEELRFSLPNLEEAMNLTVTLSKDGYIPFQIVMEITPGSRAVDNLPLISSILIVSVVLILTVVVVKIRGRS